MTISEIQNEILNKTGLKTSISKCKGSMKGYIKIFPMFQGGIYPTFPHDFIVNMRTVLKQFDYANKPLFCTISDICIYQIEDDRIQFKRESKPKENKSEPSWGSKNSQMRLDKDSARYAKRLRNNNDCARYY